MNRLLSEIENRYAKLGDTEAGANWALLALHPSIGPLELRGIPDADAFPCVCMDYETVYSIPAPSSTSTTWRCVMDVLPHPVQPVCFTTQILGGAVVYGGIMNPTLSASSSYTDYTIAFANLCSSFRMLYCGVTVDLDASATTDSGSVVAGQFPIELQTFNYGLPSTSGSVAYGHLMQTNFKTNFPDSAIAQLPGAYMGLAKDGIYMPIKLDPQAPWVATNHAQYMCISSPATAATLNSSILGQVKMGTAGASQGITFPFYGSSTYGQLFPVMPAYCNSSNQMIGDNIIQLQQRSMGHIVFYNLSTLAGLTVKVRWGVEMRVDPTSLLAPALRPSAPHDSLALLAYSDCAGSMPWAYPSEYNSNGKLMDVIRRTWNRFKPIAAAGLGLVPHPAAQFASQALTALPSFERPAGTGTVVAKGATAPLVAKSGTRTKKKVVRKVRS